MTDAELGTYVGRSLGLFFAGVLFFVALRQVLPGGRWVVVAMCTLGAVGLAFAPLQSDEPAAHQTLVQAQSTCVATCTQPGNVTFDVCSTYCSCVFARLEQGRTSSAALSFLKLALDSEELLHVEAATAIASITSQCKSESTSSAHMRTSAR